MADITSVTDNFFAVASETYSNNLSATISSLATVVPVNSAADYDDGDTVTLVVEPGTTNEAVFTGVKASSPERFIDCKWTEGNIGVGHSSGATIVDYVTASHLSLMTKGIKVAHNDDGTLKTTAVQAALNISAAVPSDYTSLAQTATTVVANGNSSYTMTFPGVNYTDRLSPGMRLRTVRSAAAPTQSTSLNGTNQYYSKAAPAGMTFTDDFVVSAWVKLDRYQAGTIVSRYNGTSGWKVGVAASGIVEVAGYNAGSGNVSYINTYQSIPLNKWVHIAIQMDMSAFTATSTTSYVMIDGVDVPCSVGRFGTNPTAIIQAGNLEIGSQNGGTVLLPGKIAQVAVFNAKVTQATMRGYMSQGILGTETSLISAFSFNNSINDLNTTNANNLTANGGAVATNADSPFGGQGDGSISATVDYGIIQKVTYSAPDTTVVVQVPEGCTIPTSGGVASVSYSSMRSPYGFPADENVWTLKTILKQGFDQGAPGVDIAYFHDKIRLVTPIGSWKQRATGTVQHIPNGAVANVNVAYSTQTTNATVSTEERFVEYQSHTTTHLITTINIENPYKFAAQTTMYFMQFGAGTGTIGVRDRMVLTAENAYL